VTAEELKARTKSFALRVIKLVDASGAAGGDVGGDHGYQIQSEHNEGEGRGILGLHIVEGGG